MSSLVFVNLTQNVKQGIRYITINCYIRPTPNYPTVVESRRVCRALLLKEVAVMDTFDIICNVVSFDAMLSFVSFPTKPVEYSKSAIFF